MKNIQLISVPQTGHICKPTAIATVDKYYADILGFNPIPLNKRNRKKQLDPNRQLNFPQRHHLSIRQLAKAQKSVQGELLEMQQVRNIFKVIGYDTQEVDFKNDLALFKKVIIESLDASDLVFAAFAVNRDTGNPASSYNEVNERDKNEHAAVIHGYDEKTNKINFTHWGKEHTCDLQAFYTASMMLLDTREPEYYKSKSKTFTSLTRKYEQAEQQDDSALAKEGVRKSIVPTENSGFRGKLIVVKKPSLDQILAARYLLTPLPKHRTSLPVPPISYSKHQPPAKTKLTFDDIKHIAHVFSDGETKGTPLEGANFSTVLGFFSDFLEWVQTETKSNDSLKPIIEQLALAPAREQEDFFPTLQQSLKVLKKFDDEAALIVENFRCLNKEDVDISKIEKKIHALAQEVISTLNEQKDLVISGGYRGHPGHQQMYRVSQHEDGIYFSVYDTNSQFTCPHNEVLLPSGKLGFYPIYSFKIPSENYDHQRLTQFLVTMFKFRIIPQINSNLAFYTYKDLNQVLYTAPTWLKADVIPPETLSDPISGQRSGTCVWKSMEQWMHTMIPNRSTYRQWLLAYRLYCFHRISIDTLENQPPEVKLILQRGLANMARMLNPELKKEIVNWDLDQSKKDKIIEYMKKWNIAVTPTIAKVNTQVCLSFPKESTSLNIHPNLPNLNPLSIVCSLSHNDESKINKHANPTSFDEALTALTEQLQIPDSNESAYISWVEAFCLRFTDLKSPIALANQSKTVNQQQAVMNNLGIVLRCYAAYQPELTQRSVIVYLSLLSIVERLGQEKYFHFRQQALSAHSLYGEKVQEFLQRLSHNPYLSTGDPALDCLWERVQDFHKRQLPSSKPVEYYSQLISDTDNTEKKVLQQHWKNLNKSQDIIQAALKKSVETLFSFSQGDPSHYCFLNLEERKKIKARLPKLNEAIQLQETIEHFILSCLEPIALVGNGMGNFRINPINVCNKIEMRSETYLDTSQGGALAVGLKLSSILDITNYLFLKRSLLRDSDKEQTLVNDVLLSSYDGNAPDSEEIAYLSRTFSEETPQLSIYRQRKYKQIQTLPSMEQQLTHLLHHLRKSPSHQIIAILSALCLHPEWLVDAQLSKYLLSSLFQPGALLKELNQSNGEIWKLLANTWSQNEALQRQQPWMVLKLTTLVANYAEDAQQLGLLTLKEQENDQIRAYQQTMLKTVEEHLQHTTDPHKLREFHHWRLATILRLYPSIPDEWAARFSMSFNNLTQSSPTLSSMDESYLQQTLYKASLVLKVTNNFLPNFVKNSNEFRELFGQTSPLAKKQKIILDDKHYDTYEWTHEDQSYRVLFSPKFNERLLQKKYDQRWYTYAAPSTAIQQTLGFKYAAFENPPALLNQMPHRVWIASSKDWMVVESGSQQALYTQVNGTCYAGSYEQRVKCSFNHTHPVLPKCLLRFEDPKFIEYLDKSGQSPCWHFKRYGLDVLVDANGLLQTKDNQYTVDAPNRAEDWFGTGLVLTDKYSYERFLIMPLQPYYALKDKNNKPIPTAISTHYKWVHDFSNHMGESALEKKGVASRGWHYTNSEHFVSFKLNTHGEPTATTTHDQLYLAYLYLVQEKPQQALECIQRCIFQGTVTEMKRLWWLVSKLPAKVQVDDDDSISNSCVTAVQLAGLQSMLKINHQYPGWNINKIEGNVRPTSNTTWYQESERANLLQFINFLPRHIENLYTSYDTMRNNIPAYMRVDEALLLSHCIANRRLNNNPVYTGVIGARYLEHFPEQGSIVYYDLPQHEMVNHAISINPKSWVGWLISNWDNSHYFKLTDIPHLPNHEAIELLQPHMELNDLLINFSTYYQYAIAPDITTDVRVKLLHFCETTRVCFGTNKYNYTRPKDSAFFLVSEILWVVLHAPNAFPSRDISSQYGLETIKKLSEIAQATKNIPKLNASILSNTLVHQAHRVHPQKSPSKKRDGLFQTNLETVSFLEWNPLLDEIRQKLMDIECQYERQWIDLLQAFNQSPSNLDAQNTKRKQLEEDFVKLQHEKQEAQRQAYDRANIVLKPGAIQLQIASVLKSIETTRSTIETILAQREAPMIAELGQTQVVPTLERLLKSYPTLTDEDWSKMGIRLNDIPRLYTALQTLLSLQDTKRRLDLLAIAFDNEKKEGNDLTKNTLIRAMMSQSQATNRQIALFQYLNDLNLRPEQANFLNAIFSRSEESDFPVSKVLQLMMGGGKTKVILPLWAYEIADGDRLAIILVPEMSLKTNAADLAATSVHSFGQEPYCLYFDNNLADNLAFLQELYDTLLTVRSKKRYIISTAPTWQAIELKYIDLLKKSQQASALTYKEQLACLSKILLLVRNKGVTAIDEGHVLLAIKKESIYAIGEAAPINAEIINTTIDLYFWLSAPPNSIEQLFTSSMTDCIEAFCLATTQQDAPLWLKTLLIEPLSKNELQDYLGGKAPSSAIIEVLEKNASLKQRWNVLREQFQVFLPVTLKQKLYEDYGPSNQKNEPFAIPYRANNVPTDCVYGHFLETINYTTQMILFEGITKDDFKSLLIQWQREAFSARLNNRNEKCQAELDFSQVFQGKYADSLCALDFNDETLLQTLFEQGHHHRQILYKAIHNRLQCLSMEPETIRSDAINLVNQFNSVSVLTGTPENYQTYHQDITLAQETTYGVEGQVKQHFLNKASLRDVVPNKIITDLDDVLKSDKKIRAVIDYGSFFCGIENEAVAQQLSEICKKNLPQIKYVLYYQKDKLYAWHINKQQAQPLPSSIANVIQAELGCEANERFTYYDQEHTLGSDITQDEAAGAVLTIDVKRSMRSGAFQAGERLRSLSAKQYLIIATSEPVSSVPDLIDTMDRNEQQALKDSYFQAGLKKINNVFRNDLLHRLLLTTDAIQRADLFQKSATFFVEEQAHDMSTVFTQSTEKQPIGEIFQAFADSKKSQWVECIQLEEQERSPLNETVANIIKKTIPLCDEMQLPLIQQTGNFVQKYREKQTMKNTLVASFEPLVELNRMDSSWIIQWINKGRGVPKMDNVISEQFPEASHLFNSNLYASANFLYTYSRQKLVYNAYTKPEAAILFTITKSGDVQAVLVCLEEIDALQDILSQQKSSCGYCLMTLNGDIYASKEPEFNAQQQKSRQTQLEQAQFLTGRIHSLLSKPLSSWFQQDVDKKIKFLKSIMPFTDVDSATFTQFHHNVFLIDAYIEDWVASSQSAQSYLDKMSRKGLNKFTIEYLHKTILEYEAIKNRTVEDINNKHTALLSQAYSLVKNELFAHFTLYGPIVRCLEDMPTHSPTAIPLILDLIPRTTKQESLESLVLLIMNHQALITEHQALFQSLWPLASQSELTFILSNFKKIKPMLEYALMHQSPTSEEIALTIKLTDYLDQFDQSIALEQLIPFIFKNHEAIETYCQALATDFSQKTLSEISKELCAFKIIKPFINPLDTNIKISLDILHKQLTRWSADIKEPEALTNLLLEHQIVKNMNSEYFSLILSECCTIEQFIKLLPNLNTITSTAELTKAFDEPYHQVFLNSFIKYVTNQSDDLAKNPWYIIQKYISHIENNTLKKETCRLLLNFPQSIHPLLMLGQNSEKTIHLFMKHQEITHRYPDLCNFFVKNLNFDELEITLATFESFNIIDAFSIAQSLDNHSSVVELSVNYGDLTTLAQKLYMLPFEERTSLIAALNEHMELFKKEPKLFLELSCSQAETFGKICSSFEKVKWILAYELRDRPSMNKLNNERLKKLCPDLSDAERHAWSNSATKRIFFKYELINNYQLLGGIDIILMQIGFSPLEAEKLLEWMINNNERKALINYISEVFTTGDIEPPKRVPLEEHVDFLKKNLLDMMNSSTSTNGSNIEKFLTILYHRQIKEPEVIVSILAYVMNSDSQTNSAEYTSLMQHLKNAPIEHLLDLIKEHEPTHGRAQENELINRVASQQKNIKKDIQKLKQEDEEAPNEGLFGSPSQ